MKPPRKYRCVARVFRGSKAWKRHIAPHDVPIAPEMNVVIRSMDRARRSSDAMGEL